MSTEPLTERAATSSHAPRHSARATAVAGVAAAVLLGVVADVGLRWSEHTGFLLTAATPWVVLAFGAGRAAGLRWSACAGAGILLTGLAAYYLWSWVGNGVHLGTLVGSDYQGITWLVAGAGIGAVAGLVGGLSRHPHHLLAGAAWSGVTAVPCIDALIKVAYGEADPAVVLPVFGAAALGLVVWAWRSGARPWVLAVGVPVASLVLWQLELAVLQQVFGRLTWV